MTVEEVKQKMKEKGLTQAALAQRCHVSTAAIALFINRKMTSARLEKHLARALGITLGDLRRETVVESGAIAQENGQ